MVGHTGDVEATVVACKAADQAVKVVFDFYFLKNDFHYSLVMHLNS